MTDTLELPPPGRATYADLEALPERYVGELIDGTLYAQARPANRHAHVTSVLGARINAAFHRTPGAPGGPPGGWWIIDEPELHLEGDVLVPDLAGWRREHMPFIPDERWFELVPDWLCEVASPATQRHDCGLKLERYLRAGVGHVWLVEPEARRIEVLRSSDAGWVLVGNHFGEEVAGIEPFAAVALDLAELWP
jgi:Uma2 family endonuclease